MAYIYEFIRTKGREPLHLEKHYARIRELSEEYFAEPRFFYQEDLRQLLAFDMEKRHISTSGMNYAWFMLSYNGEIYIQSEWLMYDKFSLRALRPNCYPYCVSGEVFLDNTSVKDNLLRFHRSCASDEKQNDVAIWHNEHGEVFAIDGSPVIAVFESEIIFSNCGRGVEFDLAYELLAKNRSNVSKGVIKLEDLPKAKELIFIDYRGVTAVNRLYDSTIYMDITAEKIAELIAEAE